MFEVAGVYYEDQKDSLRICGLAENWDKDTLTLTDEVNGVPVTSINAYAFEGVVGLKKVYIPRNIEHIGLKAFHRCPDLETVVLFRDKDAPPVKIGYQAFQNCKNLKTVRGSARIELIGDYVFFGCTSLENMPTGLCGIIRLGTFMCCPNMKTMLAGYITEILPDAFDKNHGLEVISILHDFKYDRSFIELMRHVKIICGKESDFTELSYDGYQVVIAH
jgi:hypothetical protein